MSLRALQGTAGGTAPVGGSGTAGTIPVWATGTTLGDSLLSQSGAIVTNSGTFRAANGTFTEPAYTFSASSGTGMYRATSGALLRFAVSGAYAFGVDTSGRFLIGTATAPAATGARATIANAGNGYLSINNTTSNTGVLFGVESTKGIFYTSTGAIGSESYVIASTFDTTGVQLGTTAAMVFNASGSQQGLKLPVTPGNTDPNTIDCYVDGGTAGSGGKAWTIADNSGAGLALSITSCEYIQVGKKVTICVDVTFPATASVANASLTLPIGAKGNWHAGSVAFQSAGAGGLSDLSVMCSGAEIAFYSGSVSTRRTNADMTGKRVIFSITYFSSQ